VNLPGPFLRFIGVAEVLGGVGLVLPWLLQIRPMLTPVAACSLEIIMVGAVVITAVGGSVVGAAFPFSCGFALAAVAYGRMSALSLAFDAVVKVLNASVAVDDTMRLGQHVCSRGEAHD